MNRLRSTPLPIVQLRTALASSLDALPDAELLDRFARYADHAAFEVLLRRHGPMVFGVCRRTLGAADADDAFQATFLVFLRKAKTVRGERLGPWLYGVAWRVAQKARTRAARIAARRTEGVDMLPAANENAPVPDWLPVLDAELNALPAKYRDALVRCELQGQSRAEAARDLGVREGTLSSRLARGRELLRKRLLRHGTLLPAGGLAALFATGGAGRATVPAALLATVSDLAKGGVAAGPVPVGAARLTDEVLRSMLLTKLRLAGALALLVGATAGFAAGWSAEPGGPPAGPEEREPAQLTEGDHVGPPRPADKEPPAPKLADREALQGLWRLEKVDAPATKIGDKERHQTRDELGRTHLLVAGDSWWCMFAGADGNVLLKTATLDPQKNPKWLDLVADEARGNPPDRHIYEINGDTLRLCTTVGGSYGQQRPSEFSVDTDVELAVHTFRRVNRAPVAADKELVGAWAGTPVTINSSADYNWVHTPRVVVVGEHLFALVPSPHPQVHAPLWFGGKYTVNASKNPKWLDLELVAPFGKGEAKATKMYGSYEVAGGRLKMALGTRKGVRPLDFKADSDTLVFDVAPGKPSPAGVVAQPVARTAPSGTKPLPDKMDGPLDPKNLADPAAIAGHLRAWEKWTAGVTNFRVEVKLKRTDAATGRAKTLSGTVLYMKPHFAVLRVDNPDDGTKTDYEAYICNEAAAYAYNGLAKTVTEFKRPPVPGPEGAVFGCNFFTGVRARELQERFDITLFKADEHYLYLDLKPRLTKDRHEFQHLRLALYNPGPRTKDVSYLPAAAHLVKANGDKEQWWFTNPQVNLPGVEPKHFEYVEIKDNGWKVTRVPEPKGPLDGPKP